MQRDLYAGLIKKRHKQRIAVNILQLNGRVTHEALMDEVFLGYRQRRIVLMTHTAGQDPRLPALPADVIVPSFGALARVHQPHFQYRLLPLLCHDVEAFAAMQALCSAAGSPFTVQDRIDPMALTFGFHVGMGSSAAPPHKAQLSAFFDPYLSESERLAPLAARRMPIAGVEFQGVLFREGRLRQTATATDQAESVCPDGDDNNNSSSSRSSDGHGEQRLTSRGGGGTSGVLAEQEEEDAGGDGSTLARPPSPRHFSAAAFITTHASLTESNIIQRGMMRDFFHSSLHASLRSNTAINNKIHRTRNHFHIMAVKRPVGATASPVSGGGRRKGSDVALAPSLASPVAASRRALLDLAREKHILVYEKVAEGCYQFAP